MKPIKFKECNIEIAKDQPEYLSLIAHKAEDGCITTCWKFSFIERIKILFSGRLFLQLLTFNQPLQPIMMCLNKPEELK